MTNTNAKPLGLGAFFTNKTIWLVLLFIGLCMPVSTLFAVDLQQQKERPLMRAPISSKPDLKRKAPKSTVDEGKARGGCTWAGCCGCKCCGDIEMMLKKAGFDPGSVDGVVTDKTVGALRAYQRSRGLEVTGKYNQATQKSLGIGKNLQRMK